MSPLSVENWATKVYTIPCILALNFCTVLYDSGSALADFNTLNRTGPTTTVAIECAGNETSLALCPNQTIAQSPCQYLQIDCQPCQEIDNDNESENGTTPVISNGNNATGGGIRNESTLGNGTNVSDGGVSEDGEHSGEGRNKNNTSTDNKDVEDSVVASGDNKTIDSDGESGSGEHETPNITQEPTSSQPEVSPTIKTQREKMSVEVIVAVTAAVALLLTLSLSAALLLVCVRRKSNTMTTTQVEDSADAGSKSNRKGEKHLDNPTYNGCTEPPACPQAAESNEIHVVNPLYDINPENIPDYAMLECPNYAVPGEVCLPLTPPEWEALESDDSPHNYDYADIPNSQTDGN